MAIQIKTKVTAMVLIFLILLLARAYIKKITEHHKDRLVAGFIADHLDISAFTAHHPELSQKKISEEIRRGMLEGTIIADADQIYMDLVDLYHPAYVSDKDIQQVLPEKAQSIQSSLRSQLKALIPYN